MEGRDLRQLIDEGRLC